MHSKGKTAYQRAMTFCFALTLLSVILFCVLFMIENLSVINESGSGQFLYATIIPSLKLSFFYSLIASFLSTIGGFLVVYFLRKIPKIFIFISSVPHLAFAHLVWLSYYSGGFWSKVSFTFFGERLMFLSSAQGWGIILGFVLKELPFAVLILAPLFKRELVLIEESAASLGASKFQIVSRIIIPNLKAPLMGIMLMLFTYTFGAFEIPYVLAPDQIKPLAVAAFEAFNSIELNDRYVTYSISLLLFAVNAIIYMLFSRAFLTSGQRLTD